MADSISLRRLVGPLAALLLIVVSSIVYDVRSALPQSGPDVSQRVNITRHEEGTDVLKNEERKQLPSLKDGGIVFFLHIPKVGGTTIRELIKYQRGGRRSRVNYIYLTGPREYDYTVEQMKEWTVKGTGTLRGNQHPDPVGQVVFIEYHALDRNCPTFLQLVQTVLPEWKRKCKQNNVPFFAFGIFREPLSLSVSYHNFYHRIPQNPKRFDLIQAENATENAFLQYTIANPQCLFLARNEDAYTKTGQDLRATLAQAECHLAYKGMQETLDWVGTTDRIGNETLPLLRELFKTNQYTKRLIRNLNKTANPSSAAEVQTIQLSDLSEAAIQNVESLTAWDKEMYEKLKQNYSYDLGLRADFACRIH